MSWSEILTQSALVVLATWAVIATAAAPVWLIYRELCNPNRRDNPGLLYCLEAMAEAKKQRTEKRNTK
ncbi:hypothetical protein ACUIAJ_03990 [Dermabacteraceae bacterium CCM 9519]